ncbi:hypothetical protein Bbelb_241750 [Branchiostoma belcheri]|nr:hypothetical protein Bbelb_241750 [Branchiostoma belcheri]
MKHTVLRSSPVMLVRTLTRRGKVQRPACSDPRWGPSVLPRQGVNVSTQGTSDRTSRSSARRKELRGGTYVHPHLGATTSGNAPSSTRGNRYVELHVRLPEKPDVHGTLPCDEEHTGHTGITSQTHTGHTGSTSQFNVTHITLLVTCQDMGYWGKGKMAEEGWGGGIEQGGVGTEEEDVPRNMPCQTGICE